MKTSETDLSDECVECVERGEELKIASVGLWEEYGNSLGITGLEFSTYMMHTALNSLRILHDEVGIW